MSAFQQILDKSASIIAALKDAHPSNDNTLSPKKFSKLLKALPTDGFNSFWERQYEQDPQSASQGLHQFSDILNRVKTSTEAFNLCVC